MIKLIKFFEFGFPLIAGVLLLASLSFPMWQMRMEAPQYRDEEALTVAVYPGALSGDLKELQTLNQYIGVQVPTELPQFQWLAGALVTAAALGLLTIFLPRFIRKWGLVAVPAALSFSLLFAAIQAKQQMYDIGHNRTAKTPLRGVKDFTPPFLGKAKLFQFEVASWFGPGAYFIAGAIGLQLAGAWLSRKDFKPGGGAEPSRRSATPKTKEALA